MVVSIPLALLNFGVWSLVFGYMTSKIVFMMMVVRMSGWSPRLEFDKKIAKKLFAYGKFIWGSNLVSTITNPMDKMLIGRFMGAANLGFYSIAYNLCRMPVTQISFLVNRIAFPALSKVQNDKARLMKGFMKSLSHVSIISLPIAFGLMAVAEKLVLCVYGNKWVQVIPLIKVIAFYGLTVSLSSLTTPFFDAVGKPNILLYAKILHCALKILLMFSFIRYGALGICYAILIPSLLSAIILFTLISTTHQFPIIKIAEPIFKAGLSSLVMFILIKIFQRYIGMISCFSDGTLLFSEIIVGIATYLLITFLINKTILIEFKNTLVEVVFAKSKQFYTSVGQL
jgi:O-antigen/teichoic acid export membrane protein